MANQLPGNAYGGQVERRIADYPLQFDAPDETPATWTFIQPHEGDTAVTPAGAIWTYLSGAWQKISGAIRWRGAWASNIAYLVNDLVTDGGITYVATAENTGHQPPDALYWTEVGITRSFSSYLRVGSTTAPNNTTAGDITGVRLNLGNKSFAGNDDLGVVSIASAMLYGFTTITETAASTRPAVAFSVEFAPVGNSSTTFRTLNFIGRINGTGTISFVTGGHFDLRLGPNQAAAIVNTAAVYASGLNLGSGPNASTGSVTQARGVVAEALIAAASKVRTVTTAVGVDAFPVSVNSGGTSLTLTLGIGLRVQNPPAVFASFPTMVGVDINQLTRATTNIGLRNASPTVYTPSTVQTLAAATALLANATVVMVNMSGNVTSTAAPFIANGQDGQELTILNVDSADTLTLQDQGTLASSNLRLVANTIAIGPRHSVKLMYSATVGDWVQVGPVVAVL